MLACFVIQYQKSVLVNITSDLIRKVFKYWQAVTLMVAATGFLKFESSNFVFLDVTGSLLSWGKYLLYTQTQITIDCTVVLSRKNNVP